MRLADSPQIDSTNSSTTPHVAASRPRSLHRCIVERGDSTLPPVRHGTSNGTDGVEVLARSWPGSPRSRRLEQSLPDRLPGGDLRRRRASSRMNRRRRPAGVRPHVTAPLVTIVPMPSGVKISSSNACCTRPSRMWTCSTPPSTAEATARPELRQHAGRHRARLEHVAQSSGTEMRCDEGVLVAEVAIQALDIGEVDELRRPERGGEGSRRRVGVEVVRLSVFAAGDGGDDRDIALTSAGSR